MLPSRLSSFVRRCASTSARNSFVDRLRNELAEIEAAGTYKNERVIASPQGAKISVNGDTVLNFCANNYLGLSNHPAVEKAAADTLKERGFGLSSVRFICGTQDIHKQLEDAISAFHGTEDTILYPSCFDANAGLFEAVLNKEDAIITDELNHASIIDGIRLCKAERHRFKHMDMNDLEQKLKDTQHCRTRLIATDGLFIDECHATGFFGPTGRGSDEYCGINGKVDVINSTLGKALGGSTGGYTTGRKEVVDLLRQRSRPYLFSNSLGPSVVGASLKVFEMLTESSEFVDKIRANTHHFRDRMTAAGYTLKGSRDHPIAPVMLGDARLASELADDMLKRGIYVIGFSYPCGKARGVIN
ncbi:Aminotransferase class I and II [Phytophthora infestans]|uniref:Aminotransferase class I and II n=1 Tax=Phytophthora infestans TaxID=4787 RepID=A0A833W2X3_PHYIN|nr:Aminotransferase class I and II [Phytophthora infestans]